MCYMKSYYIIFGGNTNKAIVNDVWVINLEGKQLAWKKVIIDNSTLTPCARVYHTCVVYTGNSKGTMVLYGGRDKDEEPLGDIWGLQLTRGKFEWVKMELDNQNTLEGRYNHSMTLYGGLMIIVGGRNRNVHDILPIEVYDIEKSLTYKFMGVGRFRQSVLLKESSLLIYGGFKTSNSTQPTSSIVQIDLINLFKDSVLYNNFNEIETIEKKNKNKNKYSTSISMSKQKNNDVIAIGQSKISKGKFKISNEAVVGEILNEVNNQNEIDQIPLFRKIAIDKLPDENKRIGSDKVKSQLIEKREYNVFLINKFIDILLRPFDWFTTEVEAIHSHLPFTQNEISLLIKEVKPLLIKDSTLISLRSPCKIFGNLFGQYNDLMRFFESFGNPSDENQMGDIYIMQYIFLGDFCDRGFHSLEILFLLFALKVKYPEYIYLIRGHHEDISINAFNGLGDEFKERINDNITKKDSLFVKVNEIFNYLPLGVIIDNSILCVHGGIGESIESIGDIEGIKRPIEVNREPSKKEEKFLLDLLWSEYSDENFQVRKKERDEIKKEKIVQYGRERLNGFLSRNNLNLLITTHKVISGGIEAMNNDNIIIVFSATNYMDKLNNLGGMLTIAKRSANKPIQIIPKLINVFKFDKPSYRRKGKDASPIREKEKEKEKEKEF